MCSSTHDVLVSLEAAAAEVADEPLDGRSDAGLLDRARRLTAARNRMDAALAATVRRAGTGRPASTTV